MFHLLSWESHLSIAFCSNQNRKGPNEIIRRPAVQVLARPFCSVGLARGGQTTIALQESDAPEKPLPMQHYRYRYGRLQEQTQWCAKRLDLWTARLVELAPTTEVLAVVAQEIVMALAEPRARAPHDLVPTKRRRCDANVQRPQSHELMERNLLDAAQRIPTAASVVDDAIAPSVDSMMSISSPAHDKPSARHKLSVHGLTRDNCVLDDAGEL
jgi:hypothetical protein